MAKLTKKQKAQLVALIDTIAFCSEFKDTDSRDYWKHIYRIAQAHVELYNIFGIEMPLYDFYLKKVDYYKYEKELELARNYTDEA